MKLFVRAVVTGFALSLGGALFKKVQPYIGLGDNKNKDKEKDKADDEKVAAQDGATDPALDPSVVH
jgi:hypothetical protein